MAVRRGYVVLLGGVVGLVVLWQAVALANRALDERQNAHADAAVATLELLDPVGFRAAPCEVEGHACMRGRGLPQVSVERVASAVREHARDARSRCFQAVAKAPPDCIVLADVGGVTVAGFVSPRLLPESPIRFKGSELSFVTVDGPYVPELFFSNQTMLLGPPVKPGAR